MSSRRVILTVLALCLLAAGPAWAQDTGSVSGIVFDQNGQPVAGAVVKISGDKLPAGRTFTTGENGSYQFSRLLPGAYVIEADKTDLGKSTRPAVVELDRNLTYDLVLGLAVQEALEVTAVSPPVDLKKTEVNFNYTEAEIAALPLERSYRGLFQLIPGVADNRSTIGPAAGGTRQDNTYLIDGVNITNPGFGNFSVEVNELDIAEFNVKRAGVSAEFGRSAGVVTNAVTKSGTNEIRGSARIDWLPKGLIGAFEDDAFRDELTTTVLSPAIGIGGPIIKDSVFWYFSARYFETTNWDRTNKLGTELPDADRTGHELNGKITATIGQKHLFNVGFRDRPNEIKWANIGSNSTPEVATDDDNSTQVATASWSFFLTQRSTIDVKYLFMKENGESTPVTELGYLPTWDPTNLAAMGQYSDPNLQNVSVGGYEFFNTQNYKRHEFKVGYTQFLDIGATTHELKAGFGYEFGEEELDRLANGWGSLAAITVSGQARIRARYYFDQPAQLGQGYTRSIYVQDNMTIAQRLTINAGVLMNRDEFAQDLAGSGGCPTTIVLSGGAAVYESDGDKCTFLRFNYGDEIQPRLGVNFNVRSKVGDKVYANWGRYFNMDQKSSGRSLAPRRIYQREAQFNAATGALISDVPRASTTGKQIDPDIEPIYNDEVLVGYATPIGDNYSVDVFYMYRNTDSFMEDVPTVLPDTGPYAAANLPCDRFASCQNADAKRTYKALNIEVSRRLADRWSGSASYTYTQFRGNFDLDYSTAVFNTSSFIQDGPGTNVEEPNRYGPLRQERPHVFKLFGTWNAIDPLTLSGYFRVQSGTPWNARARDWEGAVLNYLEPAGTNRNPTWANFDLLASYRLKFGDRMALTLEGRLLNVFGNQTKLSTDAQQYLDLRTIPNPPYFAPYQQPNAFYGTANGYAPPRRFTVAALFTF